MAQVFRMVDPKELRVTGSRRSGADPYKLQQQIVRYGSSFAGMPPPLVFETSDGVLVIYDGVTRATRSAKLNPGVAIQVEVIGYFRKPHAADPNIGDLLS